MSTPRPGLYPTSRPRPTTSPAEIAVWNALQSQLPQGWTAWHSLRVRTKYGYEGEGDFIIAIPDKGLLALEVKGGQIELRSGLWEQNGKPLAKSPLDQAQGYVRKLTKAISERGGRPPPFAVACIFPDTDFTEGPKTDGLEGRVLSLRDCARLGEVLPQLAESLLRGDVDPHNDKWIGTLHDLWGETWVPSVGLPDQVKDAQERAIALEDEQLQILDVAGDNERAIVTGGAGTGKTVVARELCARQAWAGKKVAYFCFTDALADAVDRQFSELRDQGLEVRALPLRRYAASLLKSAGHKISDTPEFWAEVCLEAACTALPPQDARPDFVVIDEAQDLEETDRSLIEELVGDRGLWIFRDPKQQFWKDRGIADAMAEGFMKLSLQRQHRNPSAISAFASKLASGNIAWNPSDGNAVRIVPLTPEKLPKVLAHELNELRKNGANPEDIAIVTLAGQTVSQVWFSGPRNLGSHELVPATHPDAPSKTILDTFLRFKGLERPFVIICEMEKVSARTLGVRAHIAATRATVGLIVLDGRTEPS